jgi:hypothetical protein
MCRRIPTVLQDEIIREGLDVILDFYHLQFRRPRPANNLTFHDKQKGAGQQIFSCSTGLDNGGRYVCLGGGNDPDLGFTLNRANRSPRRNQPRIHADKARIKGKRIVCKHPERRNIDSINRKLVNSAHGEIFVPTAGGLRLK